MLRAPCTIQVNHLGRTAPQQGYREGWCVRSIAHGVGGGGFEGDGPYRDGLPSLDEAMAEATAWKARWEAQGHRVDVVRVPDGCY